MAFAPGGCAKVSGGKALHTKDLRICYWRKRVTYPTTMAFATGGGAKVSGESLYVPGTLTFATGGWTKTFWRQHLTRKGDREKRLAEGNCGLERSSLKFFHGL